MPHSVWVHYSRNHDRPACRLSTRQRPSAVHCATSVAGPARICVPRELCVSPVKQIRFASADGAAQASFQLFEGRSFDGDCVAGEFHDAARLGRHVARFVGHRRLQMLTVRRAEDVANDDAEAVNVGGRRRLAQNAVPMDFRREMPQRARKGAVAVVATRSQCATELSQNFTTELFHSVTPPKARHIHHCDKSRSRYYD